MMDNVRIVLDTSSIISSVCSNGFSRHIFKLFMEQKIAVLYSRDILEEYKRALRKEKIIKLTTLSKEEFFQIVIDIGYFGELIDIVSDIRAARDPSDNKFLNCAVDGGARYLISRDKDLLTLQELEGISIIDDKEFVMRYERAENEYE